MMLSGRNVAMDHIFAGEPPASASPIWDGIGDGLAAVLEMGNQLPQVWPSTYSITMNC